ncbi:MAG: hypothetical protein FWC26_14775 [Fibromonadales bacterium]|nr:hypothetical protein [Fibromonadales bacterium]
MLISFLKGEDEEGGGKQKFASKGDVIFLLVLAIAIGGIWYSCESSKEKTYSHYAQCESLFLAENLNEAKDCYEKALELNYRLDSLDSVGYNRIDKIESLLQGNTEKPD